MKLFELYNPPVSGYQDTDSDNSKPTLKSSRKTKLTLKQIRKLRKMLDVRNYEASLHLNQVRKQYGSSAEEAV